MPPSLFHLAPDDKREARSIGACDPQMKSEIEA
jgi:hypothetical protein